MKIEFFQYIYSKYSGLNFSPEYEEDRSVALLGLEKRMTRVYGVKGRYGILDGEFLHRSLLWQRDTDKPEPLRKIDFKQSPEVPSWSWMAVMGQIRYMDAPFDWMEWNRDIETPLKRYSAEDIEIQDFEVLAYDANLEDDTRCIYDRKIEVGAPDNLKCVIIGWEKMEMGEDPTDYYVLLLTPTDAKGGSTDHTRLGVARMTGDEIVKETECTVRIV